MPHTGRLLLVCQKCGEQTELSSHGDEFDPVFTCRVCGAKHRVEGLPSVEDVRRAGAERDDGALGAAFANLRVALLN